jgi:hypothetical protein
MRATQGDVWIRSKRSATGSHDSACKPPARSQKEVPIHTAQHGADGPALREENEVDGFNHVSTIRRLREQVADLEHAAEVQKQKRSAQAEAMKEKFMRSVSVCTKQMLQEIEALKGTWKRRIPMYIKLMQQQIDDVEEQLAASKAKVQAITVRAKVSTSSSRARLVVMV